MHHVHVIFSAAVVDKDDNIATKYHKLGRKDCFYTKRRNSSIICIRLAHLAIRVVTRPYTTTFIALNKGNSRLIDISHVNNSNKVILV
jgi:hypothetical protein